MRTVKRIAAILILCAVVGLFIVGVTLGINKYGWEYLLGVGVSILMVMGIVWALNELTK